LVCGNSILDRRLSLKALKDSRQFLVDFAEQSAKLAFELPVPSRVETRFGNEKLSILIPLDPRYAAIIAPEAKVELAFRAGGYVEWIDQRRGADGAIRNLDAEERLFLTFDPSRLASLNVSPLALPQLLHNRNMVDSGGEANSGPRRVAVLPGGVFHNMADLMNVPVPMPNGHTPEYLRDMVSIRPGYESPPSFLNFLSYRDESGQWR
jgi:hypothetical protein